jgi:hypothetical protein
MRQKKVEAVFTSVSTADCNPRFLHKGSPVFCKSKDVRANVDESLMNVDEGLSDDEANKGADDNAEDRSFSSSDDEDFNHGQVKEGSK